MQFTHNEEERKLLSVLFVVVVVIILSNPNLQTNFLPNCSIIKMPKALKPKTNRTARAKKSNPYWTREADMNLETGTVRESRTEGKVDQYFLTEREAEECFPLIDWGVGSDYEKTPATFLYSMATVSSRFVFRKLSLLKKKGKFLDVPFTLQVRRFGCGALHQLAEGAKKNMM